MLYVVVVFDRLKCLFFTYCVDLLFETPKKAIAIVFK
jgi:hypothetical protein